MDDGLTGSDAQVVVSARSRRGLTDHIGDEQLAGESLQQVGDGVRTIEQYPL
jgi:hypothetical protein